MWLNTDELSFLHESLLCMAKWLIDRRTMLDRKHQIWVWIDQWNSVLATMSFYVPLSNCFEWTLSLTESAFTK